MSLSKKYGIEQDKIKRLVADGWLHCSLLKYEEGVKVYQESIAEGKPKLQAIANAAHAGKISERQVYNIIKRLE